MKRSLQGVVVILILFVGIYVTGKFALYEHFPHLDSLMHFLGGVAIGWILTSNFRELTVVRLTILALTIGVGWEIAEWVSGVIFAPGSIVYKYFHGGGPIDTVIDVALDLAGALAVYTATLRFKKLDAIEGFDA